MGKAMTRMHKMRGRDPPAISSLTDDVTVDVSEGRLQITDYSLSFQITSSVGFVI